ncbi:MAG: 3'-5' exonuclease [Dysgonamonadaceae bacterium]|jgi:DNA polymerase III epsilon subunit-like protein|nr:3'-5' exonuclease [Dysgonamonadaceae bacterium]
MWDISKKLLTFDAVALPDNRITTARQEVYKQCGKDNFDAICFLFYKCPECKKETLSEFLMPPNIALKQENNALNTSQLDRMPGSLKIQYHEFVLQQILNANIDFLLAKRYCSYCSPHAELVVQRIIYCYNIDNVDYHNYIDYPFEQIQIYMFPLINNNKSKKILFFDTETTGLPKNWKTSYRNLENWPRLVQLAWIVGDEDGNLINQYNYVIKPLNFVIPDEASKIHKISTSDALHNGKNLKLVLEHFNQAINQVDYIVAHNLNFDINVIASELYRNKMNIPLFEKKKICTMESSVDYCKIDGYYGYKYPKLEELYRKLFNTTFNEAHNASVDILATFNCFYKLKKLNIIKI